MEYVEAANLMKMNLSVDDCISIITKSLDGLIYAHEKGIYHRDIKPANILVTKDLSVIKLADFGIEVEIIDVQSLLPFDIHGKILESLKKTSRIIFLDEDVPGGTSAYMLQEVIEKQGGYYWLDSPPKTLTGTQHRPAYGSDGDYWSKPNVETIIDAVYEIMHEVDPHKYSRFL